MILEFWKLLSLIILIGYTKNGNLIAAKTMITSPVQNNITAEFVMTDSGVYHINMTWIPEYQPNAIVVRAINETCKTSCSIYHNLENKTYTLIPADNDLPLVQHRDCSFRKDCWYNVIVKSEKAINIWNKTLHAPACLNGICLCENQLDFPNFTLSVAVLSIDKINITWTIDELKSTAFTPKIDIVEIHIRVQEQTVPQLKWGGRHVKIADKFISIRSLESYDKNGYWEVIDSLRFQPMKQFVIHASLIDNQNCSGNTETLKLNVSNTILNLKQHGKGVNYQVLIVIILFFCMASIFVIFNTYKKWKRNNITWRWEEIYNGVTSRSIGSISMENNVLYIQKDELNLTTIKKGDFEINRNQITCVFEIAGGAFGRIFKGFATDLPLHPGKTVVAVKKLKKVQNSDDIDDFLSEIETMKRVGSHKNIVSLLGCCTKEQPLMLIMEYVGGGDLLNYLKNIRRKHLNYCRQKSLEFYTKKVNHEKYIELMLTSDSITSDNCASTYPAKDPTVLRPSVTETEYTTLSDNSYLDSELNENELHEFAYQISKGMEHLEFKNITHRDLAARNILITENKILKISDFGLSRDGIYINRRGKKRPLRWLSIEASREHFYSSKSDVWAFGIVLWEIGTLGGFPYHNIENEDLLDFLVSGQRLEKPAICTDQLYSLMTLCWDDDPKQRPSFSDIVKFLQPNKRNLYVDLRSSDSDYVFPPIKETVQKSQKKHDEQF